MKQTNQDKLEELIKCISMTETDDTEPFMHASGSIFEYVPAVNKITADMKNYKDDLRQLSEITGHITNHNSDQMSQCTNQYLDQCLTISALTSDQSQQRRQTKTPWTNEEHTRFLDGVEQFGRKKHTQIAKFIGTKETTQVISHSQKYFIRLDLIYQTAQLQNVQINYSQELLRQFHPFCREFQSIKVVDSLNNQKHFYQIVDNVLYFSSAFYTFVNRTQNEIKQLYCIVFDELRRCRAAVEFLAEKFIRDKTLVLISLLY